MYQISRSEIKIEYLSNVSETENGEELDFEVETNNNILINSTKYACTECPKLKVQLKN